MFPQDFAIRFHEPEQAVFAHVRDGHVPVAALIVERKSAGLGGVRLQCPIESTALTGRPEQREKNVGDGGHEEQAVATGGVADVSGRQAHPEVDVLGVSEGLLDREPTAVNANDIGCGQVVAGSRDTPRLLHPLVVDEHDRRRDVAVRRDRDFA